jgi:bacitracin transport system ATP-binding protein
MLLEEHFEINNYRIHEEGIIRVYSHLEQPGAINRLFVQNNIDVLKIIVSEDRLEDYFTKLVGDGVIG